MKKRYKKSYCKKMFDFFNIPHTYEKAVESKSDTIKYVEVANVLPTFERFAVNIGVCLDEINEWCKEHKEFYETYKKCKALQKDMLNDLAMRGFYNATYTAFLAKNITDMGEKQESFAESEIREAYLSAMSDLGNISDD